VAIRGAHIAFRRISTNDRIGIRMTSTSLMMRIPKRDDKKIVIVITLNGKARAWHGRACCLFGGVMALFAAALFNEGVDDSGKDVVKFGIDGIRRSDKFPIPNN